MENMDKSKIYISPSKESIMAYVDGEWKQFLRSDVIQELQVKTCNKFAVINWVAVAERLPKEEKFRMSADVLTMAGDKMSVKCYDYELSRWSGSPHVTVKYWMELPKPPCL